MERAESPAERASRETLTAIYRCLDERRSFLVEAGAGAGKTYSLVKALEHLIKRDQRALAIRNQKIACITYTNVAKEEILGRVDRNPVIFCDTNHGFCWSLIRDFQRQIREGLPAMKSWTDRLTEAGGIGLRTVDYKLGHRTISPDTVSLHHDDVLALTITLMENPKFRKLLEARYPVILIDEYQDTDRAWVDAIKQRLLGQKPAPLFGFFGDHWQKIYGDGCGRLQHPDLEVIGKRANFRSAPRIVDSLNRMRPELPQATHVQDVEGDVRIFHTNAWSGARQSGSHWAGDLPTGTARAVVRRMRDRLESDGWDPSPSRTRILMLTHRVLAQEQGYPSLPAIFQYNDAFIKKEHPYIAYLIEVLEPARVAFRDRKYGQMFQILDSRVPMIRSHAEKLAWKQSMDRLDHLCESGTVGEVLDHLGETSRPRLVDAITDRERELRECDPRAGAELDRRLQEVQRLRTVAYREIVALRAYLEGQTPFDTKHGVKGQEFENVLVVLGRGWNNYNFGEMLEYASESLPEDKRDILERSRNLFYVACSRARTRLALLFTQQLSDKAVHRLAEWFGRDNVRSLDFPSD